MKKEEPAKGVPGIVIPASPTAFKNAKPAAPSVPALEIRQVQKQELLSRLKDMAEGWDGEIEGLFALPERLFKIEEDTATYYSKNEAFGIGAVLDGLRFGKLSSPIPEYGVALFSTGGTAQVLLVDASRNIVVRGLIFSVHDAKQEKNWSSMKEAIKSALEISESAKKEGGVAVFDRMARIFQIG